MKKLERVLASLDVEDNSKIYQFQEYMEKILWWNNKVNLTAITDPAEFEEKHFVDSLLIGELEEFRESQKVVDIGTGGGFPGIPLAIAYPRKEFLLVDSLGKRLKIVKEIAEEIGIDNVTVLHSRAEDLGRNKDYRERFDLCVSRAVAHLAVLSEYCIPLVKPGGSFIAYKGPEAEAEVAASGKAVAILGGEEAKIVRPRALSAVGGYGLDHPLVVVKKKKKTPAAHPRKAGTPAKMPIK
ncbi:MAG: 16S rRNA (guanine(527)-N(7))-methyltransferase RsmG [Anaerovoracaceae bacterium]|jgi:16S rRNA (guanine527-N7)-methyltransferase